MPFLSVSDPDFSCGRKDGSIRGSTRGPREPKNGSKYSHLLTVRADSPPFPLTIGLPVKRPFLPLSNYEI